MLYGARKKTALVVIPARGSSKGIPRKNLRSLNGRPLIYYAIQSALKSRYEPDVYVSSEDEEILAIAAKCGSKIHRRPSEIADDQIPLDPVICEACTAISLKEDVRYDLIVTIQPTSPLLQPRTLDAAMEQMIQEGDIDTVISAREEFHLTWRRRNGQFVPDYKERVNRQFLDPVYVESGSFVICRMPHLIEQKTRIGRRVRLHIVAEQEGIDIDTYSDWNLCEYLLKRKTILFVVTGNPQTGLGHIYRCLILANSILNHRVVFLLDKKSRLGFEKIRSHHYEAYLQEHEDIIHDIRKLNPDIVVNDILDTHIDYMKAVRQSVTTLINFEDLGSGACEADLVINALYPENEVLRNHYFGHRYFCARDEFLMSGTKQLAPDVRQVLITFGGVDIDNLTRKVLQAIEPFCRERRIRITVVCGLGYAQESSLRDFSGVTVYKDIADMSTQMLNADVIFTSAGRTVYEIACLGTPAIVLAQNEREMQHLFASADNGFVHLGLGAGADEAQILEAFVKLVDDFDERRRLQNLMLSRKVRNGTAKVIEMIQQLIKARS